MLSATTIGFNSETLRMCLGVLLPLFLLAWALVMGRKLLEPIRRHPLWLGLIDTYHQHELGLVLILRWICTILVVTFLIRVVMPMVGRGGYEAGLEGLPLTLLTGIVLTIIWRHSIAGLIARPFENLYNGGSQADEPRPLYSIAQARRKQGRFAEAIEEIKNQLDRFPTDVEGRLLLAEVQARDLKDLDAAEATVLEYCEEASPSPQHLASALYSMADWRLELGRDREGARRCLQQVIERLPNTEFASNAAQRIAHLGTPEMFLPPEEQKKFFVSEGPKNLGLVKPAH